MKSSWRLLPSADEKRSQGSVGILIANTRHSGQGEPSGAGMERPSQPHPHYSPAAEFSLFLSLPYILRDFFTQGCL